MNSGTGLNILQKAEPEHYFDVGIAEQQAVLFAAGLALSGSRPVAAIYSTFLQRALRPDHPRRLPAEPARDVLHGPRRPGRRRRPDAPRRVRHRLPAPAAEHDADGPARRGDAAADAAHRAAARRPGRHPLPARQRRGRARCRPPSSRSRSGRARSCARASAWRSSATAPASGSRSARPTCWPAYGLDVTVADARFAKPLDTGLLAQLAAEHDLLVTVEEGVLQGGFGTGVWEVLDPRPPTGLAPRILRHGLPDRFVTHGAPKLLHEEVGFTPERLAERIEAAVHGPSVLVWCESVKRCRAGRPMRPPMEDATIDAVPLASAAAWSPTAAPHAATRRAGVLTLEERRRAEPAARGRPPAASTGSRRCATSRAGCAPRPTATTTLQFVIDTACAVHGVGRRDAHRCDAPTARQFVSGSALGAGPYISVPLRAGGPSFGEIVLTRMSGAEEYGAEDETFARARRRVASPRPSRRCAPARSSAEDSQDFIDRVTEELRSPLAGAVEHDAARCSAASCAGDARRYLDGRARRRRAAAGHGRRPARARPPARARAARHGGDPGHAVARARRRALRGGGRAARRDAHAPPGARGLRRPGHGRPARPRARAPDRQRAQVHRAGRARRRHRRRRRRGSCACPCATRASASTARTPTG